MDVAPRRPVAVLDANVLFSGALCDLLMRAATVGLYQAFWNETILDEIERNLIGQRRTTPEQARRRRANMQAALPNTTVQGYENRIPAMTNDPKDRHVLATAVHIGAQVIVTHNRRHFPSYALLPHGIEALSPDTFLGLLLDRAPDTMMQIVTEQAEDLKNPP